MSGIIILALRLILAVSLYAFLGWAFFNLWREIKQQAELVASHQVPPISLIISYKGIASQVQYFDQPNVTIGRDATCECPLEDESVSARHASLDYHHNQWWLEDLNSTNGTLLNNEELSLPTVIMSGDKFKCGETSFQISLSNDPTIPIAKN